jgi:hypothetical protein
MSATIVGSRLVVRYTLLASTSTPPASTADTAA